MGDGFFEGVVRGGVTGGFPLAPWLGMTDDQFAMLVAGISLLIVLLWFWLERRYRRARKRWREKQRKAAQGQRVEVVESSSSS